MRGRAQRGSRPAGKGRTKPEVSWKQQTRPLAVQNVNAAALRSTMGTDEICTMGEDASLHAWSELWLTPGLCQGAGSPPGRPQRWLSRVTVRRARMLSATLLCQLGCHQDCIPTGGRDLYFLPLFAVPIQTFNEPACTALIGDAWCCCLCSCGEKVLLAAVWGRKVKHDETVWNMPRRFPFLLVGRDGGLVPPSCPRRQELSSARHRGVAHQPSARVALPAALPAAVPVHGEVPSCGPDLGP